MQKAERELIDEKFKGVIAMIKTNNDVFDLYHKELLVSQKKILDQTIITNGRVTNLEKQTKIIRFFEAHPKITVLVILGIVAFTTLVEFKDLINFFK